MHTVIIGGGTAGWYAAAIISAYVPGMRITLIESPDIPPIGVGEGTFPSTMRILRQLGFSMPDIINGCNAGIKLGIRYSEFAEEPFWLTTEPVSEWIRHGSEMTKAMAMGNRCPSLDGRYPYAMHFVASDLAAMLQEACLRNGVTHIPARVSDVKVDDDRCQWVRLEDGTEITGDWFVDCSGFARMLIGKTSAVFHSYADDLLVDSAVVGITHYVDRESEFVPYTQLTARAAGWQFRIPTQTRIGNGIVYSSRHWTRDQAEQCLRESVGVANPRHLRMGLGYHDRLILGNIAAVGLSGGFIEPLEATAIHIAEQTIGWLVGILRGETTTDIANEALRDKITYIKTLIMAHYAYCERPEPFWCDARLAAARNGDLDRFIQGLGNGRYPTDTDHLDDAYPWCQWNELLRGFGKDHYYPAMDTIDLDSTKTHAYGMPQHLQECLRSR